VDHLPLAEARSQGAYTTSLVRLGATQRLLEPFSRPP
jgi:hypothetical protein